MIGITPSGNPNAPDPAASPPANTSPNPFQGEWGVLVPKPIQDAATSISTSTKQIADTGTAIQKALDPSTIADKVTSNVTKQVDEWTASIQGALKNAAVDIVIVVIVLIALDNLFKPDYSKLLEGAAQVGGAAAKGAIAA